MADLFASDTHFDHFNIIGYCNRPYSTVTEMNEALVANWNAKVDPKDRVFFGGDACMGKIRDSIDWIRFLNGDLYLIPGNHDRCWRYHKGWEKWVEFYENAGFTILDSIVDYYEFTVCHFPYKGDSKDSDRYQEARPKDLGRPLIHGHVHDAWKINGRQINMGVDVWGYAPVSADEIRDFWREVK